MLPQLGETDSTNGYIWDMKPNNCLQTYVGLPFSMLPLGGSFCSTLSKKRCEVDTGGVGYVEIHMANTLFSIHLTLTLLCHCTRSRGRKRKVSYISLHEISTRLRLQDIHCGVVYYPTMEKLREYNSLNVTCNSRKPLQIALIECAEFILK